MAFTFRPSDGATKALEQIKRENNIATNSKAMEYVLRIFLVMENELEDTCSELENTQQKLETIKKAIVDKFESDRSYNEMIRDLIPK